MAPGTAQAKLTITLLRPRGRNTATFSPRCRGKRPSALHMKGSASQQMGTLLDRQMGAQGKRTNKAARHLTSRMD